jgi:hypothetical protein
MLPTLLIRTPGITRALPLATSTLVGRHAMAHARLDDPRVPLLWLELRWHGTSWAWRALGGHDRTRGAGAPLPEGWRQLAAGSRVRLDEDVSVELVTDAGPVAMLVDPTTGELAPPDVLERLVELREGRMLPVAAEGDARYALTDGELVGDPERTGVGPGRAAAITP